MKTFELQFKDARNPVNLKETQELFSYDNFKCKISKGQLQKRLDKDIAKEILSLLQDGEDVELKQN